MRLAPYLEHGVILETTSADAVFIPAGWIHGTFTTQGGGLVAKDFTTSSSALPFSRYLSSGLEKHLSNASRKTCWDWFSSCLECSLANINHVPEALEAWVQSLDCIQDWSKTAPKWNAQIRKIWNRLLRSEDSLPETCPCGKMVATEPFTKHFRDVHLSFLFPTALQVSGGSQRLRSNAT